MFYTVYKITNWYNGKIYIGIHKTDDLNDDYMGSGKLIARAIEKYGLQYFTKEYLAIFDNPDDMYEMESSLVNEEFIGRDDTYNMKIGGIGGWDYIHKSEDCADIRLTNSKIARSIWKRKFEIDENFRNEVLRLLSIARLCKLPYSHTQESKTKISKKAKERLQDPTKNSQYGTMWITNGVENKKISKYSDIPEGWYKGRKIKIMP